MALNAGEMRLNYLPDQTYLHEAFGISKERNDQLTKKTGMAVVDNDTAAPAIAELAESCHTLEELSVFIFALGCVMHERRTKTPTP